MQYRNNEDEFDLIEQIDKKKGKKDENKKRKISGDGLNFDELQDEQKQLKLPSLAVRNNNKNQKQPSKSNYQKAGLIEIATKNVQDSSKRKLVKNESVQEELYEQKQKEVPRNNTKPINKVQKLEKNQQLMQEEEYGYGHEQFQQEKYEEDFEQHQQKLHSVKTQKKSEEIKKNTTINVSKPEKQLKRQTASLAKKRESVDRVKSRNSDHSINHSTNSRPKIETKKEESKKEELPNKYSSIAQKTCPNYDRPALQDFSIDKITRDNDKMRGMIKKFNDELNEMINRNILQLKNKKEGKVVVAEDVLKILQEHKNNNESALQNTIKDLERLKGKEGELRGEQFQFSLEQKIAETKNSIIEHGKLIIRLNNEVNNEGNKLSKFDKDTVYTSEMNTMKNGLALAKKDQIANEELSLKLDIKFQELNQKILDVDSRYAKIIDECKASGFSIVNTMQLSKKADDVKKKLQIARVHKVKTQSLFKTKGEMTAHELEQIRIQIKAIETQVETCEFSCDQIQNQNKKSVQKAKKGNRLSAELISYLQNIITELQNTPNNKQIKDEPSVFTQPKNNKKYQSQKNVQKVSVQPKEEKAQDDLNFKKPLLFKKKEKEEEKPEERVWLQEKAEPKKIEKAKDIDLSKFEDKDNEKKEEEKKKPFVIKKNKDVKPATPELVDKAQRQPLKEVKKEAEVKQEQIKIAPRMMKFKRNKPEETTAQPQKVVQTVNKNEEPLPTNYNSNNPQLVKQQQEQKAIFAPKRFNIKLKEKKNQESAVYVASTVETKKEQIPKQQQFKPKGLSLEKQQSNPINNEIKLQIEQQKPKFNLKLKDRQRQSNKILDAPQFTINLNDKIEMPISKQNNNPYANQLSGQQTKKARQGPLKKVKPAATIPKQQGSIYDQVEDMTNIQSVNPAQPKFVQNSSEQPDLHKLLGINKNTKSIDNDLIVDSKFVGKMKKQVKKDINFFAQLEI